MLRRANVATLGPGKVLYLHGTPYEQGKQLGQGAAELIEQNVRAAAALADEVAHGADLAAYWAMTRRNEAWVAHEYPELLDELHGIAEGSGVDYADLLHLNLNTDVAYARAYAEVLACTQVLASGPATWDGKTYIGKTRDLRKGPYRHVLLHRDDADGGYRNEFQIAGLATLPVGFNGHGVSVTTSGQWSERIVVDLRRGDSAWHILNLQPVLKSARSVDDALHIIRQQPRLVGMNAMLADDHTAVAIEVTGDAVYCFEPRDGILVRTNHFLAPELREVAVRPDENCGTFERYARAEQMVRRRAPEVGMPDILRILSDHQPPGTESICRHAGPGSQGQTHAATIICPQDRQMWAVFGNPCESITSLGRPDD
jgi:isopenicillin-N N-acyltransferase-like protein